MVKAEVWIRTNLEVHSFWLSFKLAPNIHSFLNVVFAAIAEILKLRNSKERFDCCGYFVTEIRRMKRSGTIRDERKHESDRETGARKHSRLLFYIRFRKHGKLI